MDVTVQTLLELDEKSKRCQDIIDNTCSYSYVWISVNEAAKSLGIKPKNVHQLIEDDDLISVRGRTRTYVLWRSVDEAFVNCYAKIKLMQVQEGIKNV